jgi:hypothetical protein
LGYLTAKISFRAFSSVISQNAAFVAVRMAIRIAAANSLPQPMHKRATAVRTWAVSAFFLLGPQIASRIF